MRLGSVAGEPIVLPDAGVARAHDDRHAGGDGVVVSEAGGVEGGVGEIVGAERLVEDLDAVVDGVIDRLDEVRLGGVVEVGEDVEPHDVGVQGGTGDRDVARAGRVRRTHEVVEVVDARFPVQRSSWRRGTTRRRRRRQACPPDRR